MNEYKKCKHNTSEYDNFVGYCDLYLNEDRTAGRLVECKKYCCENFEEVIK